MTGGWLLRVTFAALLVYAFYVVTRLRGFCRTVPCRCRLPHYVDCWVFYVVVVTFTLLLIGCTYIPRYHLDLLRYCRFPYFCHYIYPIVIAFIHYCYIYYSVIDYVVITVVVDYTFPVYHTHLPHRRLPTTCALERREGGGQTEGWRSKHGELFSACLPPTFTNYEENVGRLTLPPAFYLPPAKAATGRARAAGAEMPSRCAGYTANAFMVVTPTPLAASAIP